MLEFYHTLTLITSGTVFGGKVIGIGSSAGGLEALTELFTNIPSDTGMAFIVIQHMDPKHESMLKEIIGRTSGMPTLEVKNRMPLKTNTIFIIPPNRYMTLKNNKFSLVPRNGTAGINMPVDWFFSSLAKEKESDSIGVILSGAASDGTLGQEKIKFHGGITFSQDLNTSKYKGMPESAINSGVIDYIGLPKTIAKDLIKLSKDLPIRNQKIKSKTLSLSKIRGDYAKILFLMKHFTGLDFKCYKKPTIQRRISKRMSMTHKNTLKEYLRFIRGNTAEIEALFNDLLINVTSFFRDSGSFKVLKNKVLPYIYKNKPSDAPVRVWVPACSTGEEVYSIAICLLESMGHNADGINIQLFGTDVNETLINRARRGLYKENIKSQVSAERLRRFFTKEESGYKISKQVRDMCIFAKQDLTKDPPFSKLDLVSCRNMLIYMEQPLQRRVIQLLHYSLNPSGFLLLGTAESIGPFNKLFNVFDKKFKIYNQKQVSLRNNFYFDPVVEDNSFKATPKRSKKVSYDSIGDIGIENDDIQARDEELRSAFEEIQSANEELQSTNEELETSKEELQSTNEELTTLNDELSNRNQELSQLTSDIQNLFNSTRIPVIMVDRGLNIRRFTPMSKKVWNLIETDIGRSITDINPNIKVSDLKGNLIDAIEHLDSTSMEVNDNRGNWFNLEIFPYKTVENVIAGAVIVLNDITILKNAKELIEVSKIYFQNIVETIISPIVIMDKKLRIVTANKAFYDKFKLVKNRIEEKLISEISGGIWSIPKLLRKLKKVGSRDEMIDNYMVSLEFDNIGSRTMYASARAIKPQGDENKLILLSFEDITERLTYEDKIKEEQNRAKMYLEMANVMIVSIDTKGKVTLINKKGCEVLGYKEKEIIGKNWYTNFIPKNMRKLVKTASADILNGKIKESESFENTILTKKGEERLIAWHNTIIKDSSGKITGHLSSGEDITERKHLETTKNNLIRDISHGVKTPIALTEMGISTGKEALKNNKFTVLKRSQEIAERNIKKVSRDVNLILQSFKWDTERVKEHVHRKKKASLKTAIKQSLKSNNDLLTDKSLIVKVALSAGSESIRISSKDLSMLMNNIIDNAIKFTDKGTIKISSRLNNDMISIEVKDTGCGILNKDMPRIFEKFYKKHPAVDGTGLGLCICREIVGFYGGNISVKSKGNSKGTTVIVELPLIKKTKKP